MKKNLDFFHQATMRICSSLDIDTVLKMTYDFLQTHIPCDAISVQTCNPGTRKLSMVAARYSPHFIHRPSIIPLSMEAAQFIELGRQKVVTRYHHPGEHIMARYVWEGMGEKDMSEMVLSLKIDKTWIGAVSVMVKGFERYTREHERLLALLHDPFAVALGNALRHQEVMHLKNLLSDDNQYLSQQLHKISGDEIVGAESGLKQVMEMVGQVAPLNSQVLLLGETGVGKEVIANAIHFSSPRASGPLIKVNCGAIPKNLVDSELFGHEKGAFTGASALKRGRFERADKGTLFLDEIGELPLAAQVRLLRVLQTKEIERVGGSAPIPLDIRIIAATNRDLEEMVCLGQFREDLWFRLNVFPITIPPLRQRPDDLPALVSHFIQRKAREMKTRYIPVPEPGDIENLKSYAWPGNVRELENLVERAIIENTTRSPGQPLKLSLSLLIDPGDALPVLSRPDSLALNQVVEAHIRHVLELTHGKIQGSDGAAALMEIHPSTLRNKMKKLGIPYGRKNTN
ncbi:sigma-54 interaction domain-containing protein [Desulfobacter vibrioformis]|uniref:sigma-54 interaction domain-containing protein n=1 Tax=Desulfobacter vibrioformis TaxID=34031 RepID=UPI0005591022|nr:sigma 54-interacting transcriptional regulator [Desulfobacter vibrioformis]